MPATPKKIDPLSEKDRWTERVDDVRADAGRFVENYRQFQKNYPEISSALKTEFPELDAAVEGVMSVLTVLSLGNKTLKAEEVVEALKTVKNVYEHSSKTDVVAPCISLIASCAFLLGGISKLSSAVKGLKVPACLIPAVGGVTLATRGIYYTNQLIKPLPTAVMGGLTLKYAPVD